MLPLELLGKNPEVRRETHERFRYLLVDEFQDTSSAQYELMKLLVGPEENVCVVGDDDQSIYSWRGASYENILRFEHDFPRVRVIKLEQNYRSTRTILKAANALISHNTNRKPKASGRAPGRRADRALQRARDGAGGGRVHRFAHPHPHDPRIAPAAGLRGPPPGEPPHAGAWKRLPGGEHPLCRVRGHELLRAAGSARHARVSQADRQP